MGRGKTDDELLALGRANRLLEDLDDPRAQARIAQYLYMRFTDAGDNILPVEDRPLDVRLTNEAHRALDRQVTIPGTDAPARAPHAPAATGPTPGSTHARNAAHAADVTAESAPVAGGWNLSGNGSENDDPPPQAAAPAKPSRIKATPTAGGWTLTDGDPNQEVEVKI